MREMFSHRNAPVRALLVISAGFLVSNCAENVAFADDESVTTVSTPPPPHRFGDRGDVVIPMLGVGFGSAVDPTYSAAGFSINHFSYVLPGTVGGDRETGTTYALTPSVDVFIGKHVSIGADLLLNYSVQTSSAVPIPEQRMLMLGFSPRVGYAFSVTDRFTIWPRVAFGMNASDAIGAQSFPVVTPFVLAATVDVQLLYAIDRHFYVALAPSLEVAGFPDNGAYPSYFQTSLGTLFNAGFVL